MAQEKTEKPKQKIRFKDLSCWLKLSAIVSWVIFGWWVVSLLFLLLMGLFLIAIG